MNTPSKKFDARDLRSALAGFSTGVTIVTALADNGDKVGMTASSFNSVSMDPPLILWSVTKTALSAQAFHDAGHFAVHVLASDQIHLSNQFASRGADKFANLDYTQDDNGVPIIPGCVARFDCTTWTVYEGGDHWIIVGEVKTLAKENREALVFSDGSYATASPVQQPGLSSKTESPPVESPIDRLLLYNLSRAYHQMSRQFHDSVRESGLSIPAWRILASLYGNVSRELPDLEARTFLDSAALADTLLSLQQNGLCTVSETGGVGFAQGTSAGHKRVQSLFAQGEILDAAAVGDRGKEGLTQLITLLAEVVNNTNDKV